AKAKYNATGPMVYTHYPPGPDWICGFLTTMFGKGEYGKFRLFPLILTAIALAVLGLSVLRVLSPGAGFVFLSVLYSTPLVTKGSIVLYYQGYALALLLIQIGLYISKFLHSNQNGGRFDAYFLFALGFLQGWLSFDYFFLVSFSVVPFVFLAGGQIQWPSHRFKIVYYLAPGFGFALAHAIHFLQVVVYYGSFTQALNDFLGAASYRAAGALPDGKGISPILNLKNYLLQYPFDERVFGNMWVFVILGAVLAILIARAKVKTGISAEISEGRGEIFAVVSGFVVSLLWVIVMVNHSEIHFDFISRHLFLAAMVVMLVLALQIGGRRARCVDGEGDTVVSVR
ncbi:MAG: hypothetical protein N2578_06275, partial [Bdellovibrionaceae bacterium]|nr:hypothetical protein [Pseudobdellovibrionaceae bacterium]